MATASHYLLRVSMDKRTGKPLYSVRSTTDGKLHYFKSSEDLAAFMERHATKLQAEQCQKGSCK